ncbi:MAG: uroporphyrinogen-III C-methyltransferase [Pseudolabrys sp.]|nr:uroporphyrinogen-III C-methyltransferase [Pseudolabrys sp.]
MSGTERHPIETASPRIGVLARLPVFFALDGKRVVVAGGSPAAAWKAELLSAAGAKVEVVTLDVSDEMRSLTTDPPRGPVVLHSRHWEPTDLDGAAIAVGTFDDDGEAAAFAAAARAAGIPVNVIDKPDFCDFSFGSIVNRSPLVIGISTDGAAPVFAQAIRAKLEAMLPQGFALWATAPARWRSSLKSSGLSFAGRRTFWQLFTQQAVTHPTEQPDDADYRRLLDEVRGLGAAAGAGSVTLVGAGPGDPELLTLRALRALQTADVILFDDLVSREVLDFARREAKKMLVGKTGHGPACKQSDINEMMVRFAKAGKRVVRLKGGDPLIFGRAAEEIAACEGAGIPIEIVPGITAAQGAASRLGVSLTDRDRAQRVQFVTGHARDGKLPGDIDWAAIADALTTTAVYMPAKTIGQFVAAALAAGLDPATPAVAVISATRPDERRLWTPIADLPQHLNAAEPSGPVLVMIGRVFSGLAGAAARTSENSAA